MGRGGGASVEVVWLAAPAALAFLVQDAGFVGPERLEHGVAYHRAGLCIEVCYYDFNGRDPEVATSLAVSSATATSSRRASLESVYVYCGLGPAQDVPGSAQTRRALLKSIGRHAQALSRVLPYLLSDQVGRLLEEARLRTAGTT